MYSVGFLIVHCYVLSCVSISMVAPYSLTIIMYNIKTTILHLPFDEIILEYLQ